MPLLDAFLNFRINYPDVFLIDTEGYDFVILKQYPNTLPLPKIIMIEHSSLSELELEEAYHWGQEKNYKIFKDKNDLVFTLE